MEDQGGFIGQVLGASTFAGAGVAVLPSTGDSLILHVLTYLAIALGITSVLSFLVTRFLRSVI